VEVRRCGSSHFVPTRVSRRFVERAAGCDVIRAEKQSGTSTQGRAELRTVLDFIGKGDVLMVTRVDRLARSIGDLQDIVRTLKTKGASLRATEQPIDTSTAAQAAQNRSSVGLPGTGLLRTNIAHGKGVYWSHSRRGNPHGG